MDSAVILALWFAYSLTRNMDLRDASASKNISGKKDLLMPDYQRQQCALCTYWILLMFNCSRGWTSLSAISHYRSSHQSMHCNVMVIIEQWHGHGLTAKRLIILNQIHMIVYRSFMILEKAGMYLGAKSKDHAFSGKPSLQNVASCHLSKSARAGTYKIDWKLSRWIELLRLGMNHYTFSHFDRLLLWLLNPKQAKIAR